MDREREITENLLIDFPFSEILELNDLTEEDVLLLLVQKGYVIYPERYFEFHYDESRR